jgi:trk system potassium uptake protein TrkH
MTIPARYADFLRHRYRAILAYTGLISLIVSLVILSPLALLVVYPAEASFAWAFLLPGLGLALPSLVLWRLFTPRSAASLTMQEGAVIVVLTWLLALLVGSIPFLAVNGLNLTQALFESTSGWTTAGLSVIDVGRASPLILFYRSVIQLAGGAGLAIIMLSALAGPVGPGISIAEGRGEQLLPHVRRSANLVLSMYGGYVVVGILALYVAGMSWFDAVNHAFSALSTGGFSTRAASIAYWGSPAVEAVVMILMLLGTLNFLTAYTLLQRKVRAVARNSEVRQSAFFIALGVVVLLAATGGLYPTLGEGIRVAFFNAVSALSTTGFSTVDYGAWGGLGWFVLIVLMLMGGGTGSTAGGIKQYRILVLYRGLIWEFRRRFLPHSAITEPHVWKGEQRQFISDRQLRQVAMFVFLYLAVFLVGSGILTAYGYSLQDSLFEFASALSTVGISVGITAAEAPPGVLWVEMVAMFLGRLEFFTVIVGLVRILGDVPTILSSSIQVRLPGRLPLPFRAEKGQHGARQQPAPIPPAQDRAAEAVSQETDPPPPR